MRKPLSNLIPGSGPQPKNSKADPKQCPFCKYRNKDEHQVRIHIVKSHNGFA